MRVILHAGFHKTGTSTAQESLRLNRDALAPYLRVILRPDMVAVCDSACAYSISGDPLDLSLFQYELARLAEGWDIRDTRAIVLASEDLCGHMPGRHGLPSYSAAPQLMLTAAQTLIEIRPDTRPEFFFSTRAAAPWLASCHAQHLDAMRMTLDVTAYARTYCASADLDTVVAHIASVVAPHQVHTTALEDSSARPLGPLDPILDILTLPPEVRTALTPHPPANPMPPQAVLDRLLELNRLDLSDDALRDAKRILRRDLT